MQKKEIVIYVVLTLIIGFFTTLLAVTKYESPEAKAKAISAEIAAENSEIKGADTVKVPVSVMYPNLGNKDVFTTIIPKPTPAPTPVPTQKPKPDIKRIVGTWKLTSLLDDFASFEDTAKKQTFDMKIGEAKEVQYLNDTCQIILQSIDMSNLSVTVKYEEQTTEIKMIF